MNYVTPNVLAMALALGWPLIALSLFLFMPPRRALIMGYVVGWLFLPVLTFVTPLVLWDKHLVTSLGALLGAFLLDTSRLLSFRPKLLDLPMLIWCLVPIPAAVTNGFGAYTATADTCTRIAVWGIPYLLGRVYFNDLAGMRSLAAWIFMAGLLYVPFCLFEIRLSPQLHRIFYGYSQYEFSQVVRMGGYRPTVFLQHGLALGMVMAAASLAGIALAWNGAIKRIFGMPVIVPLSVLLITTLFAKSAGALLLMAVAVALLFLVRKLRTNWLALALVIAPVGYMVTRGVLDWDFANVTTLVSEVMGPQRAESLQFRLDNEKLLLDRAAQRRIFGWGANGDSLVVNPDGVIESVADGDWVIALGTNGLVGLLALYTALLLPVPFLLLRIKPELWNTPAFAGVCAVALLLPMHAIDNLFNAMLNPIFILAVGGVTAMAANPRSLLPPMQQTTKRMRMRRPAWTRAQRPQANANPDDLAPLNDWFDDEELGIH